MRKQGIQPEEIFTKLRHADVLLGHGKKLAEVVKALGVIDVVYSLWYREFRGLTTGQAKWLEELKREDRQLRKIVVGLPLDKLRLHEAAHENL